MEALGKIGGDKAFVPIIRVMKDKDYFVRASVAKVLGDMGGEKVLPFLIRALEDKEEQDAFISGEVICWVLNGFSEKSFPK